MSHLQVTREDGITRITVARPEVLNALNLATMDELGEVLAAIRADPACRALVLTGAGDRSFIAGGDLKELQMLASAEAGRAMAEKMKAVLAELASLPVPTIAAVNGFALGGGCEVAVACDFRIAADTARLGYRQIKIGLISGWGGGPRLVRLLGRQRALRLMLTGEMVRADAAMSLGLVDRVVPPTDLLEAATAWARELSAGPPAAVAAYKRLVDCGPEAASMETDLFVPLWTSKEHDDLVRAMFKGD